MTHNWIIASGSATWQAASFDTGILPASGDTVNVTTGTADISAGLNQSAVALAALNVAGAFQGTIGDANGNALQIGVIGTCLVNAATGRCVLDFGTSAVNAIMAGSGGSLDTGLSAIRLRGGGAGSKLYVAGSSTDVGVAQTKNTLTARFDEWDQQGGNLYIGPGTTWTNGFQSGGTATINSGGTAITQTGSNAQLLTQGTGAIGTISATGQATLNHRPAAPTDAIGTLNVGPGAIVDFSTDPRPLTITNIVNIAKGGSLTTFDPQQVQLHSGSLQVRTQQCGLQDVTIAVGSPILATLAQG